MEIADPNARGDLQWFSGVKRTCTELSTSVRWTEAGIIVLRFVRQAPDTHARLRPPNGVDVKPQAAHTRERTGGAPLAAMHMVLTLSVCKRRDAVRLALNQPARPAGAAFGGLSASAAS